MPWQKYYLRGNEKRHQTTAGSPRHCLGPPAEGSEGIYCQQDVNHAQVARGAFGLEGLDLWYLVFWWTGPTFPCECQAVRQLRNTQ